MQDADSAVIVVGGHRLQSELLGCRISCKTGLDCSCLGEETDFRKSCKSDAAAGKLVLFDVLGLEGDALLARVRELLAKLPADYILALYNLPSDSGIETEALELGVRGFFYQDDSADSLAKGVGNIIEGDVWLSRRKMVEYLLNSHPRSSRCPQERALLTRREKEILRLVATGASNDEIAGDLCVSSHTVRTHIYHIFKKIKVGNRLQATLWAEKNL